MLTMIIQLAVALVLQSDPGTAAGDGKSCRYDRIVSLAPSITETLFALGLGENVEGVTRFCSWPPEAVERTDVGGYLDPDIEAIVSLRPDLVIMLPGHEELGGILEEMGIELLVVSSGTVGDILEAVRSIGRKCGVEDRAALFADSLEAAYRGAARPRSSTRPGVLIIVDRDYGTHPEHVFAAGPATWYDELLEAAGGRNVLGGGAPAYPMLSPEGILSLSPDIIIEVVPGAQSMGLSVEDIVSDWEQMDMIEPVAEGRVYVLTGSHAAVPGPRFVILLEEMSSIVRESLR